MKSNKKSRMYAGLIGSAILLISSSFFAASCGQEHHSSLKADPYVNLEKVAKKVWNLTEKKIIFDVKNFAPYTVKCNFGLTIELRGAVDSNSEIKFSQQRSDDIIYPQQYQTITFDFTGRYNEFKTKEGQDFILVKYAENLSAQDCKLHDSNPSNPVAEGVTSFTQDFDLLPSNTTGEHTFTATQKIKEGLYIIETVSDQPLLDTTVELIGADGRQVLSGNGDLGYGKHEIVQTPKLGAGQHKLVIKASKKVTNVTRFKVHMYRVTDYPSGFHHSIYNQLPQCSVVGGGHGQSFGCFGHLMCRKANTNWSTNSDIDQWCLTN